MKELNKDYNIYVASTPENLLLFEGNNYVYKVIPKSNEMQSEEWLEGVMDNTDFFEVIYSDSSVISKKEIKVPYSNLRYA